MAGLNQLLSKPQIGGKVLNSAHELSAMNNSLVDFPRIPTYILPFDFAVGGGIPCNVPTQFYGPYQAGKSTLAYLAARGLSKTCMRCLQPIAKCKCSEPHFHIVCSTCGAPEGQCKHTGEKKEVCSVCGKSRLECTCGSRLVQKTFLCHLEGLPPDELYFQTLGYPTRNNLIIGLPEYGEQACEMIEAAIKSDDCGLVIVDSLADIVPKEELDCAYEDAKVAMQARLIARLFRRLAVRLVTEYRRGHLVGIIFLNQVRSNIGGGRFDPVETTPGGWASKHAYRLSVRVNQLSVDAASGEKDKTDGMKNVARFSLSMLGSEAKQQMLILSGKAEYKLVLRDWDGHDAGTCLDKTTFITLAKETGMLEKTPKGYELKGLAGVYFKNTGDFDQVFKTGQYVNSTTGEVMEHLDDILKFELVKRAKAAAIRNNLKRNTRVSTVSNPLGASQ